MCHELIKKLETCGREHGQLLAAWILPHAPLLATAKQGSCRVIQKVLDVLPMPTRALLVACLSEITTELCSSWGNFVLQKSIEVSPRPAFEPIIRELEDVEAGAGGRVVAKHRYGSRVLERLIEHGSEEQMVGLLNQCIDHTEELSMDPYGNFVVQRILERFDDRREEILLKLLPNLSMLACHRSASHVVHQAMDYLSEKGQEEIAIALLQSPTPYFFYEVAASRYGSRVIEKCMSAIRRQGLWQEASHSLADAPPELRYQPNFRRVAAQFVTEEQAA